MPCYSGTPVCNGARIGVNYSVLTAVYDCKAGPQLDDRDGGVARRPDDPDGPVLKYPLGWNRVIHGVTPQSPLEKKVDSGCPPHDPAIDRV